MTEWSPAEMAALAALCWAGVQVAAASRRDVGALTVALGAMAVLLLGLDASDRALSGRWLGLVGVAAVTAGVGWVRAARHGVGRPALWGGLLAVGVLAALLQHSPAQALWQARGMAPDSLTWALAAMCGLAGLVGAGLALERPGPLRARPRLRRVVPIERGTPAD